MKKYIILTTIAFIFFGCAQTSFNDSAVRQSEPVFIDTIPKNSKTYIYFNNLSKFESNLINVLNYKLHQNGYEVVENKEIASVLINLNLNYFRKNKVVENRPTIGFGVGSRHSWGFGYGFGIDNYNNNYFYDAQLSLKISINNGQKIEKYTTNLDYQNTKGYNSMKVLKDDFDERISEQIVSYLKNMNNF